MKRALKVAALALLLVGANTGNAEAKRPRRDTQPNPVSEDISSWSDWHFGAGLTFEGNIPAHGATTSFLLGAEGNVRWVESYTHLGIEARVRMAAWVTGLRNGSATPAIGGGLFGVAAWEDWGLFIGVEGLFLDIPVKQDPGWFTLGQVKAGGEWRIGEVRLALWGALPFNSEVLETSVPSFGLGAGFLF